MVVRPCLCVGLAEYREPSRSCRGYANLTTYLRLPTRAGEASGNWRVAPLRRDMFCCDCEPSHVYEYVTLRRSGRQERDVRHKTQDTRHKTHGVPVRSTKMPLGGGRLPMIHSDQLNPYVKANRLRSPTRRTSKPPYRPRRVRAAQQCFGPPLLTSFNEAGITS